MSFIRAKEIPPGSGNWYDYEVKTVHEGKYVRQKVIQYLGKSSLRPSRSSRSSRHSVPYPVFESPAPVSPSLDDATLTPMAKED
jgi:hypothetical protein